MKKKRNSKRLHKRLRNRLRGICTVSAGFYLSLQFLTSTFVYANRIVSMNDSLIIGNISKNEPLTSLTNNQTNND